MLQIRPSLRIAPKPKTSKKSLNLCRVQWQSRFGVQKVSAAGFGHTKDQICEGGRVLSIIRATHSHSHINSFQFREDSPRACFPKGPGMNRWGRTKRRPTRGNRRCTSLQLSTSENNASKRHGGCSIRYHTPSHTPSHTPPHPSRRFVRRLGRTR